jgi:hypothetical protein
MNLEQLAADLKAGNITIAEWEAGMRQYLREQYEAAMILAKGGRGNITQSDWGYDGAALKKQYQYLSNFANEIKANPEKWLAGTRLDARMDLYKDSAYAALEDFRAREALQVGATHEKNELGDADHCPGCYEAQGAGIVPIGTLVPVGARDCMVRCKCTMHYYRQEADGSYTEVGE